MPASAAMRPRLPALVLPALTLLAPVLLAALLLAPPAQAQPSDAPDALPDTLAAQVERLGAALTDGGPQQAVIGVVRRVPSAEGPGAEGPDAAEGGGAFVRHVVGFGAGADAAQSGVAQPGADAVFEIGSITKAVVGVLLADAVARGALTLDTPVAALLPDSVDVPAGPDGAPITLAHLATHRSGLPRLPSNLMATMTSMANPYAHYDAAALYAFLDGHTLAETPGAAYAYSNLGGGLLGHALARHAGAPLDTLVRRRLARPLGMDDMRVALDAGATGRLVPGYTADGTPATRWTWQALAGAGALHATTADLLTLAEAALAPDTTTTVGRALARAATPLAGAGRPAMRVGYGWHLRMPAPGRVQVWHNGGTGGHSSFVGYDAEAGAGVVVLVGAAAGQAATRTGFRLLDALAATP